MKRLNGIYDSICSLENLRFADLRARKSKRKQYGIRIHDRNGEANLSSLHARLLDQTYRTSPYTTFTIFEPKERLVYRLPYFPDRIAHHAIMRILEPMFVATFTADTFSCIKGRGIHRAANAVRTALRDVQGTYYCLKLDIKKFYPSVDHEILKQLLRRKIKDARLLWLLDEIIDSAPGLPIGNYLSQYLANFYLTYFDHWMKEDKRIRYYFRYADDLVILAGDKKYLHDLLAEIGQYLTRNLRLTVKHNYQIFPVNARSVDFLGYRFYHSHILMRKSIKQNFARRMSRPDNLRSFASYWGWAAHCNSRRLVRKIIMTKNLPVNRLTGII